MDNAFLFNVFWAVIIFILGWFISRKIGDIVEKILIKLKLHKAVKNLGWVNFFEKYETRLNINRFFGVIVEIFFIILVLMVSIEILGFSQLTTFFMNILEYYPNIFISSIIFIAAVFIADFSKKIVFASAGKKDIKYSNSVGNILSTGTWILSVLAILYQLKIVPDLILTLFIGVVATFTITLGIAFGLGGKELAKKFLEEKSRKVKK